MQAYVPMASGHDAVEMYQKRNVTSPLVGTAPLQSISVESDIDTEFEDVSDFDDYQGRRSEASVRSLTHDPQVLAHVLRSLAIQPFQLLMNSEHLHPPTSRALISGCLSIRKQPYR